MDTEPFVPVAVWVQTGATMTMVGELRVPATTTGPAIVADLPAMLRSMALQVEMHTDVR